MINHSLQIRVSDICERHVGAVQKGQSVVVIFEVERTTHATGHLMKEAKGDS